MRAACFSPDGTRIATVGTRVTVWDARTGEMVFACEGKISVNPKVRFSPDGKFIASANGSPVRDVQGQVLVWDARTGLPAHRLEGHTGALPIVHFSPDSRLLVSAGGEDGQPDVVKVWDVQSGRLLQTLKGHAGRVVGLGFDPDGQRLASACSNVVSVWDTRTGKAVFTRAMAGRGEMSGLRIERLALSPDGARLATMAREKVKLWDAATGQELHTLAGHRRDIRNIAFSPDGARLATIGDDEVVKVWDAATGREVWSKTDHVGRVSAVCYSRDGKRLATGSADATVIVWDAATGEELFTHMHTAEVWEVSFSPDGSRLAATGADGTVKVWDTERVELEETFRLTDGRHFAVQIGAWVAGGFALVFVLTLMARNVFRSDGWMGGLLMPLARWSSLGCALIIGVLALAGWYEPSLTQWRRTEGLAGSRAKKEAIEAREAEAAPASALTSVCFLPDPPPQPKRFSLPFYYVEPRKVYRAKAGFLQELSVEFGPTLRQDRDLRFLAPAEEYPHQTRDYQAARTVLFVTSIRRSAHYGSTSAHDANLRITIRAVEKANPDVVRSIGQSSRRPLKYPLTIPQTRRYINSTQATEGMYPKRLMT